MAEPTFTAAELAKIADRETGQRLHVYPRLVAAGRMTQAKADRETAGMREIARRLQAQAQTERSDLFALVPTDEQTREFIEAATVTGGE